TSRWTCPPPSSSRCHPATPCRRWTSLFLLPRRRCPMTKRDVRLRVRASGNGRVGKPQVDVFRDGDGEPLFGHRTALDSIEDRQRAAKKIAERLLAHRLKIDPRVLEHQLEKEFTAERNRRMQEASRQVECDAAGAGPADRRAIIVI